MKGSRKPGSMQNPTLSPPFEQPFEVRDCFLRANKGKEYRISSKGFEWESEDNPVNIFAMLN